MDVLDLQVVANGEPIGVLLLNRQQIGTDGQVLRFDDDRLVLGQAVELLICEVLEDQTT